MKKSEQLDQLAAALATAQGQFTAAERDYTAKVATRKGGEYQFNYADLAAYLDVCRGPLSENGIAVLQEPVADGRKARVTTLIVHKSGQWIEFDPLELEVAFKEQGETPTPQEMGSLITYARRYSQSAALNMASEADDDGNAASGNQAQTGKRHALPPCPKCGENTAVIIGKPEYGGGYVCFGKKGGCGWKWQPGHEHDVQPPPDSDPVKRAREAAAAHGMTTGDQIKKSDAYDKALAFIEETGKSFEQIEAVERMVDQRHQQKKLTDREHKLLIDKLCRRAIELCKFPPDLRKAVAFLKQMREANRITAEEDAAYLSMLAEVEESLAQPAA